MNTKNFELKAAARANLGFISSFAVVALTVGAVACGSDKQKVSDGNITNGNVTIDANHLASGDSNKAAPISDCNYASNVTFQGSQSAATYTINGNTSTLGTTLFITTNPNNPNSSDLLKTYKLAAFDYDYCAFTGDFGYGNGPLGGFHNATFYLINNTPGAALTAGAYTIGGTTGKYVLVDTSANAITSVVQSSTGGSPNTKCVSTYQYPISGTITLDADAAAATNGTHFISNVTGSYSVTLNGNATLSNTFASGACSGNAAPNLTRAAGCTCGL